MSNVGKKPGFIASLNREDIERKIYKLIGIEYFRKLVFLLERVIHYKDKGKNVNYHIKNTDFEKAKDFKKFLYYNGTIHVRNAIFLFLLIIVKVLFLKTSLIFDIILGLNLIKDIYCIILQRYNYVRINKYIKSREKLDERRTESRASKFEKVIAEKGIDISLTEEDRMNDLELISQLQGYLSNVNNVFIDDELIQNLRRIKNFLIIYSQNIASNNFDRVGEDNIVVGEKGGKNNG
ncbi:MAG: hypothetical protein PHS98_02330 [Bacilli bacterium]|nr:hypothetical protein [Bacilli bacterium]